MIQLKKDNLTLTYGSFDLIYPEDKNVFAYTRTLEDEQFIILGNLSHDKVTLKTDDKLNLAKEKQVLNNYPIDKQSADVFTLMPFEARVYKVQR